nr:PREDICTED: protein SDA1 homolog isoform X1 [Bemisia tabaci]
MAQMNLPQLQNLIKRDPESYKDEFLLQRRHFQSLLSVFLLRPSQYNKGLDELVMFMAQVAHCYKGELSTFAQEIIDVLQNHNTVLDPNIRMTFCRALILLRNKGLLTPTDLLSLFFSLLRCQDKSLRKFLQNHIINDIKNINSKHKDMKLNSTLQTFMYSMLNDHAKAAKMSVNIMIELYKKRIWNDAKTVNVLATACFSKVTKVMVAALKFFQSSDDPEPTKDSDDSDDEINPQAKALANKFNKKTRKRKNMLEKTKKAAAKEKKKKGDAPSFNFSALNLIHDPQSFSEKLFAQLEKRHERFEVRLMTIDVISRLIGLHQLFLFNFYPYIQRFLQPHQKEVTKLLQYVAQSAHELVPPDVLEPVLKTMVNNFVTERNSTDAMAIGLNAIRELCARCPLVMNEDLLKDLIGYSRYRDKSVMMAARALLHLYRASLPTMLAKKDRGRPTQASIEIKAKKYGEIEAVDYVAGAEVLLEEQKKELEKEKEKEDAGSDSDSDWVDVSDSASEGAASDIEEEEEEEDEEGGDESEEEQEEDDENKEKETASGSKLDAQPGKPATPAKEKVVKLSKEQVAEEKRREAALISSTRILTDEDFAAIDAAQARKHAEAAKNLKRKAEALYDSAERVKLEDIENIYKKKRHDKEARMETVLKGREGREKFGWKDNRKNPFSSKTNREKKKNKNFMMLKHKVGQKIKRSFKDKQIALRDHLIKLKKMK